MSTATAKSTSDRPMRVGTNSPLRELPAISATDWENVRKVKRALRDLEIGDFNAAAQVVDAMGRDDRIEGVLATRVQGMLGLPIEFEPQGDARRAKSVATEVEEAWRRWFPKEQLEQLLTWGRTVGLGLGQIIWEQVGTKFEPRLKVWHPQYVFFRWDTRTLEVATDGGGTVEVRVGDPQWLVYAPHGIERGWMRALVRSLAVPWLIRQWGWRDWGRYSEVHGLPTRKGKVPSGASPEDKDRFIQEIAGLGTESVIRLPQGATKDDPGFDVELLEAESNTWEGFEKLLQRADTCIAVRVLGQNLTTEVQGGSYAAANVHDRVRTDFLRADAESLAEAIQKQTLADYARFNYGDPKLAPLPKWDVEPPEDEGAEATAAKTLAEAVQTFQQTGAKPDVDAIMDDAGIPRRGPAGEPPAPAPQTSAPGEPGTASRQRRRTGLLRGQLYADELADRSREQGAKALGVDLREVLTVIEKATSYSDLREKLLEAYRNKLDATDFARLMEKTLILAELNGRYAIAEDL